jgi:hypothetical protein
MSTFRGWPERKTYPGIEGAREFLRDWLDAWEDWELEVETLRDAKQVRMEMYADPSEALEAAGVRE